MSRRALLGALAALHGCGGGGGRDPAPDVPPEVATDATPSDGPGLQDVGVPAGQCGAAEPIGCGDTVQGTTVGRTSRIAGYDCGFGSDYGKAGEVTWAFSTEAAARVTARLVADDTPKASLDVVAMARTDAGGCDPQSCALGDDDVVFEATPGEVRFITVDSYQGESGAFTLEVLCCTPSCGGKACGTDGCGGSCGDCKAGDVCTLEGACIASPEPLCVPLATLGCGAKVEAVPLDGAGSTSVVYRNGCNEFAYPGPEKAWAIDAPPGTVVTATVTTADAEDDHIDVAFLAGATCDGRTCVDAGSSAASVLVAPGGTYHVLVDGFEGAVKAFSLAIGCCTPSCDAVECGSDGCGGTCGGCDPGLVCGDGGVCGPAICTPVKALACGDVLHGVPSDGPGSTDVITANGCSGSGDFGGPELAWSFQSTKKQTLTVKVPQVDADEDLDVFILGGEACNAGDCLASGVTEATIDAEAGATYHILVDGYAGNVATFDLEVACCVPTCAGKACGSDGCDGTCGACPAGSVCAAGGKACEAVEFSGNDTCSGAAAVDALPFFAAGTTAGAEDDYTADGGACGDGLSGGPDVVFAYTPSTSGVVEAWLDPYGFTDPKILYALTDCDDVAGSCLGKEDFFGAPPGLRLSVPVTAGKVVYFVVDGFDPSEKGVFGLHLAQGP